MGDPKTRGIIFTGESVRAILAGRKAQTRRLIKSQREPTPDAGRPRPFSKGQCLHVKEAFLEEDGEIYFKADEDIEFASGRTHWTSPLYMPRAASRITLEVTDVRAERLLAITEEDAIAEGVQGSGHGTFVVDGAEFATARTAYLYAWDGINPRANHDRDPWVWRVVFKRIESGTAAKES